MKYIEMLLTAGLTESDLWDLAEYMLLGKEAQAGRQDAIWETRWQTLSKRGTGYVNTVYRLKLEGKINSDLVLQYLESRQK